MFRFSIIALLLASWSCTTEPAYFQVSEFEVQEDALQDMEEVQLLYAHQAPTGGGKGPEFFSHYIVVSQSSQDTVNVLSPGNHNVKPSDARRLFVFASRQSRGYRAMLSSMKAHAGEGWSADSISKVARDPEFDEVARNSFPTVIGALARPSGKGY